MVYAVYACKILINDLICHDIIRTHSAIYNVLGHTKQIYNVLGHSAIYNVLGHSAIYNVLGHKANL